MRRRFRDHEADVSLHRVRKRAQFSLIVRDLADSEEALELAMQFVEGTGQTVSVFDAGGGQF